MKRILFPILLLCTVITILTCPIQTKADIKLSSQTAHVSKSEFQHSNPNILNNKLSLNISNCHILETIPIQEEVNSVIYENILTVEDYFNMFPEAVQNAFYDMGWNWVKTDYDIGEAFGYGSILGLTIWAEKQIYINYTDKANAAILHEVGHAFEYSPYVKGVRSQEFLDLYNEHWKEWYYNYGMHINNYNTPEEGYAQCWEIYMLEPWCLDEETRAFIESEIYGVG